MSDQNEDDIRASAERLLRKVSLFHSQKSGLEASINTLREAHTSMRESLTNPTKSIAVEGGGDGDGHSGSDSESLESDDRAAAARISAERLLRKVSLYTSKRSGLGGNDLEASIRALRAAHSSMQVSEGKGAALTKPSESTPEEGRDASFVIPEGDEESADVLQQERRHVEGLAGGGDSPGNRSRDPEDIRASAENEESADVLQQERRHVEGLAGGGGSPGNRSRDPEDIRASAERLLRLVSVASNQSLSDDANLETSIRALRDMHTSLKDTISKETTSPYTSFDIPSFEKDSHRAGGKWSEGSWQRKVLRALPDAMHKFFLNLLLLDILILFAGLAIDVFYPLCSHVIENAISCCPASGGKDSHDPKGYSDWTPPTAVLRILKEGGNLCTDPLIETGNDAGCDPHKYPGIQVAREALFWSSIGILIVFEVELFLFAYLVGPGKFFRQMHYVVDLFIVTTSLALELVFHFMFNGLEALPGIFVIFRMWRFVRIGHGLVASTHEAQEHKIHSAINHLNDLEARMKRHQVEVPERPEQLRESSDTYY